LIQLDTATGCSRFYNLAFERARSRFQISVNILQEASNTLAKRIFFVGRRSHVNSTFKFCKDSIRQ
jgi:hypothetical protein